MKNLPQKGSTAPVLIIIIVVLLAIIIYFVSSKKSDNENVVTPSTPTTQSSEILSSDVARALVIATWGDCTPDACSRVVVSVEQKSNQWYITATYEGLRDDSTSAQRKVAIATHSNGQWSLGTPTITQSCQPNRGHQDFTSEPCI